jgi:hypothetical protein
MNDLIIAGNKKKIRNKPYDIDHEAISTPKLEWTKQKKSPFSSVRDRVSLYSTISLCLTCSKTCQIDIRSHFPS